MTPDTESIQIPRRAATFAPRYEFNEVLREPGVDYRVPSLDSWCHVPCFLHSLSPLIHHQGIICGVAFDRSSLRRIAPYASVVAPRRLASNTLLVIRNTP